MFYLTRFFKSMSSKIDIFIEGIVEDPNICCICKNEPGTLLPTQCVKKMEMVHKICETCWWDEEKGFARENGCHKCPGCMTKNMNNK